MLAVGSRAWTLGGEWIETRTECCRLSMLEIGTQFTRKTRVDQPGIKRVRVAPVYTTQEPRSARRWTTPPDTKPRLVRLGYDYRPISP